MPQHDEYQTVSGAIRPIGLIIFSPSNSDGPVVLGFFRLNSTDFDQAISFLRIFALSFAIFAIDMTAVCIDFNSLLLSLCLV